MNNNLRVDCSSNSCTFSISEVQYKIGGVNKSPVLCSVIPINKIFRFINNELIIPSMDAYMLIRFKIHTFELYNESKDPIVVYGQVPLYKIKGKHSANSTFKETQICVVMLKDYLDEIVFEAGLYFEFQNVGLGLQEEVSNLVIFINAGNNLIPSFYSCHSLKLEYSVHQMDKYDPFKVFYYEITHTNTPASLKTHSFSETSAFTEPSMHNWEDMEFYEKILCVFTLSFVGAIFLIILAVCFFIAYKSITS